MTQPSMRYLALGDSYTIGEGVPEAERWPVQLAARLRMAGLPLAPPQLIARSGWSTDELAEGIALAAPVGPFDLISLLIGVNNQYRGRSLPEYGQQFGALLAQAIAFAGAEAQRVLVLSIPDWGVTPFALQMGRNPAQVTAEINVFNALNEEVTHLHGARYVNVTAVSRRAAHDPALLAPDGLHPSGLMYAEWVRLALPEATAAIVPVSSNP